MRSRGGSIADIVLLIVAGNDGVKPQTIESIEIIKKSSAKPIVVINKVDLPDVNITKIKRDITSQGLQVEGMGGKYSSSRGFWKDRKRDYRTSRFD